MLSLGLKRRRTKIEIDRDRERFEEEKQILGDARQMELEITNLRSQKEQDNLIMQNMNEEIRKLRGEHEYVYQPPQPEIVQKPHSNNSI